MRKGCNSDARRLAQLSIRVTRGTSIWASQPHTLLQLTMGLDLLPCCTARRVSFLPLPVLNLLRLCCTACRVSFLPAHARQRLRHIIISGSLLFLHRLPHILLLPSVRGPRPRLRGDRTAAGSSGSRREERKRRHLSHHQRSLCVLPAAAPWPGVERCRAQRRLRQWGVQQHLCRALRAHTLHLQRTVGGLRSAHPGAARTSFLGRHFRRSCHW